MSTEEHLEEAKKLYQRAVEEFESAKDKNDGIGLRDAFAKGWLSTIEASHTLFLKNGVREEQLPKTDRGRRYMVYKYADEEIELLYFSLRDNLHIEGYYNGSLGLDEAKRHLDRLNQYIQKIEGIYEIK